MQSHNSLVDHDESEKADKNVKTTERECKYDL